jgi:hypothetical protein
MPPLPEVSNLIGTAGLIGVLVWFARRFLERWEKSQGELVTALTGVIKDNSTMLGDVREALTHCRQVQPQYVPILNKPLRPHTPG